jgi:hypothetical protein
MTRPIFTIAATFALLFLGACGKDGTVYPGSVEDVHSVLADIDELPPVFGGNEPDHHMDSSDPKAISWIMSKEGSELMRFTATLQPEEPSKTRVTVTVSAPTEGPYGNMDQRLKEHNEIRDLYVTAMTEQVAAKLEGREFDITRIYGALATATAANIGSISRQMDGVAEADSKRDEANIRKAYADEAAGQ